ncbi:double-strand-break repair protein rad21 [Perkinsela sp. CCAP 1560/4]|nr:double-strand-break repair protein rad21 [Perkinsela sp. CCAP 1560/4]KNH09101.1 double-strand-break repair protein rad21 [Perkinsela sp. CCAP 1560/4]|eukprot:KNH05330.1 double-strand-break repair protein rad21 [Perkinsela sp. CCAP 1560/4]
MFYHTYILTKRGPLAKIWLAAHWDRKLTKNDVKVIDLPNVVLNIIEPVVPISLRTSGELMLGVVRVYGHKVRILLKESHDVAQELSRGKDTHHATMTFGKGKNAITNETISAVTYTEPIDTNTALSTEKGFDKEFAMIEHLVMNTGGSNPAEVRKPLSDEQSLINTWFRSGPGGKIDHQQYNPANTFLDFRSEVNRDFFHRREESQTISDPSKKSSSSGSSIEALRRSMVPPSAEKNRFHIDVGLPVEETAELPEIPDLAMRTPLKLPPYEAYGEMGAPMPEETPAHAHDEPPRKKRLVLKQSLVDAGETVISSEAYRKTMKDRNEILLDYYRQGSSFYPDEPLPAITDMTSLLAEDRPWKAFEKIFGEKLKANAMTHTTDESPAEFGRQSMRGEAEEPLPEFASNLFPMHDFGHTDLAEPPFAHAELSMRIEEQEKSSSVFLADLQKEASAHRVVIFDKIMHGTSRRSVARHFGDLLALASRGEIQVQQDRPFHDIRITV